MSIDVRRCNVLTDNREEAARTQDAACPDDCCCDDETCCEGSYPREQRLS